MVVKKMLKIKKTVERNIKKEIDELERKLSRKRVVELETEIVVALIFVAVSGFYILNHYGVDKLIEVTAFWMFPASIMIFLTLLIVFIIEQLKRYR